MSDSHARTVIVASTMEDELPVSELGAPLAALAYEERYEPEELLGEGGMGAVRLYRDKQVGRRVALKSLRAEHRGKPVSEQRFVREARVQGQLEHPSIVPVYDLGIDPAGSTYFTMKRVRGVTLAAIVDGLAANDPSFVDRYSRRRLLTAFSQVCLAVDFAHRRGVVHRDLKPGNVMLGDFGEVYVLDWGLAKPVAAGAFVDDVEMSAVDLSSAASVQTKTGTMLGTPGYMSPEQLRGGAAATPSADVYALGAILFEILALAPLHLRTSWEALLSSTLEARDTRPSERAPGRQIPPELDAICVHATKFDPVDRYLTARAMQEAIERFLDGERDLERRAQMAAAHASEAASIAARIAADVAAPLEERRRAMQEIGRALALDPGNAQAVEAMVRVLTTPAVQMPDEVAHEIEIAKRKRLRWVGRVGATVYASMLLYLPLFLWCGVRDWAPVILFYLLAAAACGSSLYVSRQALPSITLSLVPMVLSGALCATTAAFFGPLLVTPMIAAVNTAAFTLYLDHRYRVAAILVGLFSVVLPTVLQFAGAVPSAYAFVGGNLSIQPMALAFPATATLFFLTMTAIAGVLTAGISVTQVSDFLGESEKRLYLYTWHLRALAPRGA